MSIKSKVEKLVSCSYCGHKFKDAAKLLEHINSVHNGNNTGLRLDNRIKQDHSMAKSAEYSLDISQNLSETLNDLLRFPLIDALTGRRSRRFCLGAAIPDGVLSFISKHDSLPLSEIEQLLVLTAMGGVTGWHFAIMRPSWLTR